MFCLCLHHPTHHLIGWHQFLAIMAETCGSGGTGALEISCGPTRNIGMSSDNMCMRFDYVVLFGKGDLMAQPREWYSQFQFASSAWMQACPIKMRKQNKPSRKSKGLGPISCAGPAYTIVHASDAAHDQCQLYIAQNPSQAQKQNAGI